MERRNRYDGLHPAAVSSIRHHANHLASVNAIPGMDQEDYQQELALHLIRRIGQHDERRGSLPTFISRVIENRAKSFRAPTATKVAEREMRSLDAPTDSSDDEDATLADLVSTEQSLWAASRSSPSTRIDLQIELKRLEQSLPPGGHRCLGWLIAGGVDAAICDGVHRSSFYDALQRLRVQAQCRGLEEYLRD